jgi:hypothetical protein
MPHQMVRLNGRKDLCVQPDLRYGDFGSQFVLKIELTNFIIT